MSRTKNTLRNIVTGLINKIILMIFPFVIRALVIQKLGTEYLGLSSLFTSILQVLNLTEMGFSNAIIFSMYDPISKNNKEKICSLLNFYKKAYRIIGIIILAIGLCILPFIKNLINGTYPDEINIYILYFIYLFNTVITYFMFAYKNALIVAHQRIDIINNVQTIIAVLRYILQIIILIIYKNYYLFILIETLANTSNNLCIAFISQKKYPEYICKGRIDTENKNQLKKNIYGLIIQKICSTTRNSFDSIFISTLLGLTMVAQYNNYFYIMTGVITILGVFANSMVASIGNSVATESIKKNYDNMNKINFIYMWIVGVCTIFLLCLYQPFMKLWMGEQLMLPFGVVICFCFYFYQLEVGEILSLFKQTAGTWFVGRYELILETITNIILNYFLGKFFGIYGIIMATYLSLLLIGFTYGTYIIFKYYLKGMSMKKYYLRHLIYFISTFLIALLTYFICSQINFTGVEELFAKFIVCLIVPNILYFCIYYRTNMFKESKMLIKNILEVIPIKNKGREGNK